jgi:lipid-A-disaccharide synthase
MGRRVFLTVAEVSGDQHAAKLARELKSLMPDVILEGHGGPAMRAAGVQIHHDTVTRAAMGFKAVLRALEIRRILKWTARRFAECPPDLQVSIDSWSMNYHFARLAHDRGRPVLYYIAPQAWASREGRVKKLAKVVDRLACILPFEEEFFRRRGVNATFVGHPLFDHLPRELTPRDQRFPQKPPVIGLLPGSRRGVAKDNFPHLLAVANRILAEFPAATFLIPTTPNTQGVVLGEMSKRSPATSRLDEPCGTAGPFSWQLDGFDDLVPRCDLCVTVSGTATLHVAGYHVPMIVVYRGSRILWHLIGWWLIKTRTYSLVNLLNDSHDHLVPEFIPWYGSADIVADRALEYLRQPEQLDAQRERLMHLIRSLDKPGASHNVAQLAMELLDGKG